MVVKVAINGYGTIGKRTADAVTLQDDMEIVGATKTRPTFEARLGIDKGIPMYAAGEEHVKGFEDAGIKVEGTLKDLMAKADIVVDCTPGKVGIKYKPVYEEAGARVIYQGGEKHETAGISFNAMCNYKDAWGAQFVRVVSCNTTGLLRTLYPLHKKYGIEQVFSTLIRRSADPGDSKKGPINAIEPVLKVPSHHGPDVKSVVPDINIQTMAVKVPTTIMHLHSNIVMLKDKSVGTEDVLAEWRATPRVKFVRGSDGIKSSAQIMELARDLGRPRCDFNEIIVWEDGAHVVDGTLYYYQAIHQESDVIPEIIDCIRSMTKLEENYEKSMQKTDRTLGISKD